MLPVGYYVAIAKNGRLGLNAEGEVINVGRHRGREVVQAGSAAGGEISIEEARTNRIITERFIDSIGITLPYGKEPAQLARAKLAQHIEDGKPLDERVINQVLSELDSQISAQDRDNCELAERFSDPLGCDQGREPNINSEWSQIRPADNNESPPRLDTNNFFVRRALSAIEADILELGDDGRHKVTEEEAQQIAESHLAPLVEHIAMDEILEASPLDDGQKANLRQMILTNPTLDRHTIAHEANLMRLEEFVDGPGLGSLAAMEGAIMFEAHGYVSELEDGIDAAKHKLVSQTAQQLGQDIVPDDALRPALNNRLDQYLRDREQLIQYANRNHRETPRLREAMTVAIYTNPHIETEQQIDALVASSRPLLDHVEGQDIEEVEKARLRRMVMNDPGVNTREDVDRVVAARQACLQFSDDLTKLADDNDPSNAYVSYRNSLGELSLQDGLRGMTLVAAKTQYMSSTDPSSLGQHRYSADAGYPAGWHHGAQSNEAPTRDELKTTWGRLTDQKAQALKSGVQWLAEEHDDLPGVKEVEGDFRQFSTEVPKTLGGRLHLLPAELAQAVNDPVDMYSEEDVPDSAYNVYRDLNVPVPLPNPVGRSQENTALGERFNRRLLEGVSERASAGGGNIVGGMAQGMHQEFSQARFSVSMPKTVPLYWTGADAQSNVNRFFGDDAPEKLAVSRILNASMFTDFATATAVGDGPFSLAPQTVDDPSQTQRSYWLFRASNGHCLVDGTERKPVEALVDPSDGSVVATDPAQSYVEYQVHMAVDARGGEEAPPRVRLVGPATCSYKFVPQEQGPTEQD